MNILYKILYKIASMMPKKFLEACAEYIWFNGTNKLREQYIEQLGIERDGEYDARLIQYLSYWNIVNAVTHPQYQQRIMTMSSDIFPKFNKPLFCSSLSDDNLKRHPNLKLTTKEDLL